MSRPRYRWWGYVRAVIRHYPDLSRQLRDLRQTTTTPRYGSTGGAGGPASPVEAAALRQLPRQDQRKYDAVRAAAERTQSLPGGEAKVRLIELVFWRQSHTLQGAALEVHCGYRTARRWQCEFILRVAEELGLVEKMAPQSQKTGVG